MKMSRRAERMARTYKRHKGGSQLNLVSLMDIFTILVFFLLVNTTDVEVLPHTKAIKLPESFSEEQPERAVTIMVTRQAILVQGQQVLTTREALERQQNNLPALAALLEKHLTEDQPQRPAGGSRPRVNIMADKDIPYRLLKKIMLTSTLAGYGQVSLAVLHKFNTPGQ